MRPLIFFSAKEFLLDNSVSASVLTPHRRMRAFFRTKVILAIFSPVIGGYFVHATVAFSSASSFFEGCYVRCEGAVQMFHWCPEIGLHHSEFTLSKSWECFYSYFFSIRLLDMAFALLRNFSKIMWVFKFGNFFERSAVVTAFWATTKKLRPLQKYCCLITLGNQLVRTVKAPLVK